MATNDVDDPWFWDVGRVCQELTTDDRSWNPPALSSPNPESLRRKLFEHGVDGMVLISSHFTRRDLSNTFKIFVINQQTWLLAAITQFQWSSPEYLSRYPSPAYSLVNWLQDFQQVAARLRSLYGIPAPASNNLGNSLSQPGPQPGLPASTIAAVTPNPVANPSVPQIAPPGSKVNSGATDSSQDTSAATGELNTDGDLHHDGEEEANSGQGSDEPVAKRHKSGSADPTADFAPLFVNGAQEDAGSAKDLIYLVPSPEPSTVDLESSVEPDSHVIEDRSHGLSPQADAVLDSESGVRVSSAKYDDDHPSNTPPSPSTPVVPEAAATIPAAQGDSQVSSSQSEAEPLVQKQPKRLALGMLTHVGEIDPNRNRALPTYEDDILGLDIPDSSAVNRKRVAPQLLPTDSEVYAKSAWAVSEEDIGSDQSDVEAANQLHQEQSDHEESEPSENPVVLAQILPTPQPVIPQPATHARRRRARAAKYLPMNKLPVDDIFYGKVPFGADLPVDSIEPEDKYFSHVKSHHIPPGQVRYVGKMIRNYILSKQDLDRTPRASGTNFSNDLLAVDILRDAEGKQIPAVVVDSSIFIDADWEAFVPGSDEGFQVAQNSEAVSRDSHVVSGMISEQDTLPAVASETTNSCEGPDEEEVKDDRVFTRFTAVRTYHEGDGKIGFMTLLNTPSFTLYYTSPEGTVRARREKLVDWPELMGRQNHEDFVAHDPLQLIGRRPELDPDSLLHWETGSNENLPGWGESGQEGCYDTDTWKEIDRERGDIRRRRTRLRGTHLNPIQLKNIWNQAVNDYIEKWQQQKLPKLEKTAAGIWLGSRRTRTKRVQIKAAQNDLQHLQNRLANQQAEFDSIAWSSWTQALRGCRNMELTVFGIQTLEWTIDTLQQKTSPGVPFVRLSKRVSKPKTKASRAAADTDDDLEDDMEGFITDDEAFDAEGSGEEEMVEGMQDSDDELVEGDRPNNGQHYLNRSLDDPRTPVRKSQSTKRVSEVIDLTDSPPLGPCDVDLITPEKRLPAIQKAQKVRLLNRKPSPSPIIISSDSEAVELPPFTNPMAIAEFPFEHWEKAGDRHRLLIRIFYKLRDPQHILQLFASCNEEKLWNLMCEVVRALQVGSEEVDDMHSTTFNQLSAIAQVLAMYMECKFVEWGREMHEVLCEVLLGAEGWWPGFYKHCSRMERYLDGSYVPEPRSPSLPSNFDRLKLKKRQISESDDDDEDEGPTKRRRVRGSTDADEDDGAFPATLSPHSTRKRPVIEDMNAREARKRNAERIAEQERRRTILKAKLAESGNTLGQGKTKHIINDAATLDQGHVYVNEEIGHRIKEHQVDGVRFMWNQIVAVGTEHSMQGCLLAHTMGLGKTMQVITLLVAISEAASSSDPSISSQIPSSLKGTPKTLVLCPPGLIDNWMDELLYWTPGSTLGEFWKIGSSLSVKNRLQYISEWHSAGGVLIVGYEMLRNLVQNKTTATRQAPLTVEEHKRVLDEILNGPDIIIADEAHKLKNAKSGLASAASGFRSRCRIALTGSPLANNVEEYHSMIEFVQPGYLGGVVEFRSKYKEPIEEGLFADSDSFQRRTALKMLGVLNKELALKVNRADLSVLRNDLPPKKEFVISVPLTDIQRKVYSLYVKYLKVSDNQLTKDGEVKQTTLWSWLATLSLLCNHPYCFDAKMKEGKEAPSKQATPENSTDDDLTAKLIDVPLAKTGLSTTFIEEVTRLFADEDLTQVNLSNKVAVLCQILDAAKEARDKTLIFSSSIPTLNFLENLFKRQGRTLARLDGKTAMAKRQRLIKKFNKGYDDVFLISTTAGGLGLNLQSANRVVIFDFKYNPIQEEQAVGRAFRIGQSKRTFVYRFVCGGTFEDNVHNKTVFKSQLASRVVDKKSPLAYAKKKFGDFLFEPKDLPQKDLSQFRGMDPEVLDKILASQAQRSTIRSIVQTDTFEMDDEDRLTPEEQKEVDRMCRELELQQAQRQAQQLADRRRPSPTLMQVDSSMPPQLQAHRSARSMKQSGPSTAAQFCIQHVNPSVNRPAPPAMSAPHSAGHEKPGNETPIRPPLKAPRGPTTPSSSARTYSAVASGGNDRSNPPIMGANTRALSQTPPPYRKAEEARHQANMISTPGPGKDRTGRSTPTATSNGGSSQSKQLESGTRLFPIIASAYKSSDPMASAASGASRISDDVYEIAKSVNDDIRAAIHKRFARRDDREQQLRLVLDVLSKNPATCCQLIESKLSGDDFVQSLLGRGPSSAQQSVCISQSSTSPFRREAHAVGSSQSTLMTSTSQPMSDLHHTAREPKFDTFSLNELERYLCSKNLSIIGSRQELIERCRDQDPNLILANDTSHEVLAEKQHGGTGNGDAAEIIPAIAPAVESAPSKIGNNFTRLLMRMFSSER
ncbi:hypothetical protein ONS96_000277 [Cadophora gregata f. sp. sojae]|nr:hypothetical protein ONS96_000277 [Cadophora gregata f. sp. sojae]